MTGPAARPVDPPNDEQLAAIRYTGGPFIVLAGPGTGKTRVIVERVAHLVRDQVDPGRIVAVTFTVKAAEQLRARLAERVGASAAERVRAHTFHGFALRLLRRFGDMLGLPSEPVIIDSAQRRRIAREVARRDGIFAGHAAEGLDTLLVEGLEHIHAFQHAGRFPDQVLRFAEDWSARLEAGQPGLDADALEAERARCARFTAFARLYQAFQAECNRRAQLTHEDLILLAIRLLSDHPAAAAICRDEFRHVVVDEFQDVNAGQIELLRLLCPPAKSPDLCVVGDDDQSIYLFRGADDRAFEKFTRLWAGAPTVTLDQNYRSEACILGAAAAIIRAAGADRFAPDKVVRRAEKFSGQAPAPGAVVECVACDDETSQFGEAIAAMILTDRAARPGRPWSDYAIIARAGVDLDRVGAALELEDIPVRSSRAPSALEDPGVKDVLAWVEVLADPNAVWDVQRLLLRPPISAQSDRVHAWIVDYAAQRSRHRAGEVRRDDPGPFLDWLASTHGDDPPVARLLALHEAIRDVALCHPADRALLEIIRLADAAHADLLPGRDRARRVARLAELVSLARASAALMDSPGDIRAFRSYMNDLDKRDSDAFRPDEDRIDGPPADEDASDAVTLLTAHKAKGLEFDTVFVVRVAPQFGFPRTAGDEMDLPGGFEDRAGDERTPRERRLAEERRLFYVACTRAQRRLVLLAKRKRSRSSSTDFFQELTLDNPRLVVAREVREVFDAAAEAGVRLASAAAALEGLSSADRLGRHETLNLFRRTVRADAARALELVDRAGVTREELDQASSFLRDAAARLAVIGALESSSEAPPWTEAIPGAASLAQALGRRLRAPGEVPSATRPLVPPLRLSYSSIYDYTHCPRCFYLKHVLHLPEPGDPGVSLGDVVHRALQAHFRRVREAEAEGVFPPGLESLRQAARTIYFRSLHPQAEADPDQLAQLDAMLANVDRLHDPADEIVELELSIRFDYEHQGAAHCFTAKLDRLDLWPGGGNRIVDYKTGRERDALLEPEPDDLQLGVYALALRHHQGIPLDDRETPARGVAEYWHLPSGRRGRIDLGEIAYPKIRARIDGAIEGMLAGDFAPRPDCRKGLCRIADLGP